MTTHTIWLDRDPRIRIREYWHMNMRFAAQNRAAGRYDAAIHCLTSAAHYRHRMHEWSDKLATGRYRLLDGGRFLKTGGTIKVIK